MFYIKYYCNIIKLCESTGKSSGTKRENVLPAEGYAQYNNIILSCTTHILYFGYAVNGYDQLVRATRYTTTSRMMATGDDVRICERGRTRSSGTRKAHGLGGANSHTVRGQRGVTHKHIVLLRGGQTGWYNIIS